ncbi:phage head closure protein [Pelosinus baikalensis]|uniref:Phage head closure protein n=1 Tax=Pelosinus baikalensis TaxID=2892015 RepID=A0ABS8HQV3_9FIRM|nr:phage head closure protein [Pelosinus baikalensis]MCC5465545.1 phage head closure protein [Pelosinus baikalensis]
MLLSKADVMKAVNKKYVEKIILQQVNMISDGAGGFKPATGINKWITVATVWSEFRKPNLKTEVVAGAISSVLLREIGIRYRTDVKKGWQVLYGAKTYSVEHTYNYGTESTILVCKEVVK